MSFPQNVGMALIKAVSGFYADEADVFTSVEGDGSRLEKGRRFISDTGKLVIGTSSFRATHLLPKVIKEFISTYPGIELEIVTDNVNRLKAKSSL